MPENQRTRVQLPVSAPNPAVVELDVKGRNLFASRVKKGIKFRSAVSPSLLCSRCSNLLAGPVQTPCGHRYCTACIAAMFEQNDSPTCLSDECGTSLSRSKLFRDRSAEKEISSVVVFCAGQQNGCNWEGAPDAILEHESQCEYAANLCDEVDSRCHGMGVINYDANVLHLLMEKVRLLEEDKRKADMRFSELLSVTEALTRRTSTLEDRVTLLTTENKQLRHELQHARAQPDVEALASHDTQLQAIDRTLAVNSVEITDMRAQLDMLNVRMQNGVLVWKISNFARHLEEAKANKCPAIYSQPFYTSPCGYKLCARLYLNGDGVGRGTHMSLFLVIMRGEYDAVLPWPFRQKVTLTLLDQDSPADNVSESFHTDPNSSSFQRPTSELNIASGCPRFVSHLQMKESHIRGDNLFLKVQVDADNIPAPDRFTCQF